MTHDRIGAIVLGILVGLLVLVAVLSLLDLVIVTVQSTWQLLN